MITIKFLLFGAQLIADALGGKAYLSNNIDLVKNYSSWIQTLFLKISH